MCRRWCRGDWGGGVDLDRIRAVAFDAVGTLIHPEPSAAEVYARIGRRFGSRLEIGEIRNRFRAAFAEQEAIDRANGWVTSEERERRRWQDIVAAVLDDVHDQAGCFAKLYAHFGKPGAWRCEPASECFEQLRQARISIALASNYDHRLHAVLDAFSVFEYVTHRVISSEVGWRKPAPQFFARLAETFRLPAEAVLYVGDDWDNDYEGARRAGMPVLLFDPWAKRLDLGGHRIGNLRNLPLTSGR